eukprot:6205112-Heterocapsa_arctica.AAC.1
MNKPGKGEEPNNNANIETKTVEQWWEAQEKQKEQERVRDLKQACDKQDRLDMGKRQPKPERHEPGQIYQE